MTVLVDHNLEGHAQLIGGVLIAEGWFELMPIRMLTFLDVDLPTDSDDRTVWRLAQAQGMLLLTGNRGMKGDDSLEQTLREENTSTCLPVITIGSMDDLRDSGYRARCAWGLVDVIMFLERYIGVGRVYIP